MPRAIAALCLFLLLAAWWIDISTPQALVAAILFTIPVALSGLLLNRRATTAFVACALIANASAGWLNGLHQGYHWDAVAILNRALAAFSAVLVAVLGTIAQEAAERSGRLAARQRLAERERLLRRAFEAIRSSVNAELVSRATVREAVKALNADEARLYTIEDGRLGATTYVCRRAVGDVSMSRERPPDEVRAVLQRVLDEPDLMILEPSDTLARFALHSLKMDHAMIVALVGEDTRFGVLLLSADAPDRLTAEDTLAVRIFGEQATQAAAQAHLFVELAEKNQALEKANRSIARQGDVIREIVYALSHDLRVVVAAARTTMQQAREGLYGPLPEGYRDALRRAITSTEELGRLAETLLLVARYESGARSPLRYPVALARVAQSAVDELRPMWTAKSLRVELGIDDPATVLGDESELRRAVINLLANAIAWTPEGGAIDVRLRRDDGRIDLEVADTGSGVPPEQRPFLFERRPARVADTGGAGSGLDLYLVRRIAESHGGSVRYAPREPSGSRFIVELPA